MKADVSLAAGNVYCDIANIPNSAIHSRNVSFNDLRDWKVNPTNELQLLKHLNVTGNHHWLPGEQLLQLRNLTTVEGMRLSQYCQTCSLCKMTSHDAKSSCSRYNRRLSSGNDWKWHDRIPYGRALDFIKLGFWPTCFADDVCMTDQHFLPYFTSVTDVTRKSSLALYATGSVALLVNIAVVVFIVLHKSLRNDLAVRLLLNVAVCDALIALVSILFARFNSAQMYIKHLLDQLQGKDNGYDAFENKMSKLANIMGPILTCAVTSHVFGSGISMLDKFFKIVFAMKPDVRLGRKTAVVLLVFSWSLSATFAVVPIFGIGRMTYTDFFTPLPIDRTDGYLKQRIGFAFGSQIALVILQLVSFLLYVPIFFVAKKSGTNVGVKREAAIARKIALLLCTNFIFFTIPVVLGVSQRAIWEGVFVNSADWKNRALSEVQWTLFVLEMFPVLCLSINSLANPFLYALRHPKLKQQLNPLLCRCWAATRDCFGTLRKNLRCHTANNVEVEMQERRIPQGASLAEERNDEVQSRPIHSQRPSNANELNCEV